MAEEIPSDARSLGVALLGVEATTAEELDIAFASATARRAANRRRVPTPIGELSY